MGRIITDSGRRRRPSRVYDEHWEIKVLIQNGRMARPKDMGVWINTNTIKYMSNPLFGYGGNSLTTVPVENYVRKVKGAIKVNKKYKYVDLYLVKCAYGKCKRDCTYCDRLNGILKNFDNGKIV